jgi:predicted outer membrane lipoprotein
MPNGIDLILADHEMVKDLFARFDETRDGTIVGQVIDALTAHDQAEHAALYPLAALVGADAALLQRCELAHSLVKKQFDVITALEGAPLVDAFAVLRALVTEHVTDEERNLLPAIAAQASEQQLEGLGARILQAKQRVG